MFSLDQAVYHALTWGARCYVFRDGIGFDWDIRSHGEKDVYVTLYN